MLQRLEQRVLGPIYGLTMRLRRIVWRVRRPTLIGVRVLIVADDRVLLIRHRAGTYPWSLPGGGVERFERMIEAARREAQEETGVQVRVERLQGVYDNFQDNISNCVAVFVAAPLRAPQPPRPPRSLEIAEARWFPLDALPDGADPGTRRRVAEYRAGGVGLTALW